MQNHKGAFYGMWYIMLGVLIGLMTMSLIMTILSFKYLKARPEQQKKSTETNEISNDKSA